MVNCLVRLIWWSGVSEKLCPSFLAFKENQFLNPDRPESIGIEVLYEEEETPDIRIKDDLDTFVDESSVLALKSCFLSERRVEIILSDVR